MAFPIGMLEYEPAATNRQRVRVLSLSENGAADTDNNSNYHIYRWNAFDSMDLGGTEWQVATYWNSSLKLVVGVRAGSGDWTLYTCDGAGGRPDIGRTENDNHNNCNCALDSAGYIHISYDHHADPLHYRRSSAIVSSFNGAFGSAISMVGTNETEVSYPTFFRDPLENLYFIFRDGESGDGDLYMYGYTVGTTTWTAAAGTAAGKVIDGKGSIPNQNAYWHGPPVFTSDWDGAGTGFMYLGWIWRETTSNTTGHDVSIVRWNGASWTKIGGSSQTVPITLANCDIINAVAQSKNLTGFNSILLDSSNRPHLFQTYQDAGDSNRSKIFHTYWNGSSWTTAAVTPSSATVEYGQNGVEAVIDPDDTIRVIACHPTAIGSGIYAWVSNGDDWATVPWTMETLIARDTTIVEGSNGTNVGGHHDRYQWSEHGIYRMMVPLRGQWAATEDDLAGDWDGYIEATADAPTALVHDVIVKIAIDNTNTEFWAAVDAAGDDVRVAGANGQQFPRDLVEWNYGGQYALVNVLHYGEISAAPTVRVYAGNAGAAAPGDDDTFGRHATYPYWCRAYWPSGGGTDRTPYNNDLTMAGSPSTTANTGPMGQTTYDFNGTTQYGTSTVSVPSAPPFTLMARFKSDSAAAGQVFMSLSNSGLSTENFFLAAQGNVASDPLRFASGTNAATISADKIGYTTGTWYHGAARAISTTSRYSLLDGSPSANSTTLNVPSGVNRLGVAVLARSALDAPFDGKLADVQVYDLALSAENIAYDSAQGNQATFWNGWTWTGNDDTPPTASGWATNAGGTTITATLSESGCIPSSGTGGFTLNGTAATVSSWAISGTTLILTLAGKIYDPQTVTISYDDALTSDDITDAASNKLADISNASVTNNSTVVGGAPAGAFRSAIIGGYRGVM